MRGLFIFRRDLRTEDNVGWRECLQECSEVYPVFIFNKGQIDKKENKYFSERQFVFFLECVRSLGREVRLSYFYGSDDVGILGRIFKENAIDAVFFNRDYTPFARARDEKIEKFCEKEGKKCVVTSDYLLTSGVFSKSGELYEKFTPFYREARKKKIAAPMSGKIKKKTKRLKGDEGWRFRVSAKDWRKEAKRKLGSLDKDYGKLRDQLTYETTGLSKFIRFGVVSIREVYEKFRKTSEKLLRQLFWREFFYQLAVKKPEVLSKKKNFTNLSFPWLNKASEWKKWKEGNTGFAVVDAAMRELKATGYISNRKRLIVADFLTKIYQIDWRKGERYFAQQLIDYDPIVNNLSWQSVIFDYSAYRRVYSPLSQQERFDGDLRYVRRVLKKSEEEIMEMYRENEEFYRARRDLYFRKIG